MSDDLISRQVLLDSMYKRYKEKCDIVQDNLAEGFFQMEQLIKEQPATYDDKVIEKLKELKTYKLNLADAMSEIMCRGNLGTYVCLEDVIEIVKSGGVAND